MARPTVAPPNPALVSQRAVQRLPRLALLLFCAAYLLPGLFGREPWRNADITAFGYMADIARGATSWLHPTVGGLPGDSAVLPYWLGAISIRLFDGWLGPALAARLPFALLLGLVLMLTWYSTYHLARGEAAQPLPFAFGGEATPVDYARAVADGALLALIASLGLLQLGHETTPELGQLAAVALFLYGLSAAAHRPGRSRLAVLLSLPMLAASGAPATAMGLCAVGLAVPDRPRNGPARGFATWVGAAGVLAATVAFALGAWAWRVDRYASLGDVASLVRLLAWFCWPAWPLALWTLWRWRRQWRARHIAVPLGCMLVGAAACIVMGGSDRALMLALPPLAALAAFALPTLQRSTAAAIDWFSVFFFSICAIAIWVIYVSLHTGVPAKPAANVMRLAPGFEPSFSPIALVLGLAGTLAWLWLVRWRTGRNRHALWKSLVLPASGVALCWLLLMTLWLPLLDYARSYRPLIVRIAELVPHGTAVCTRGVPRGQLVALEYYGGYRIDATGAADASCDVLMVQESAAPRPDDGWVLLGRERRPTDRTDWTSVYRRAGAPPP